jgi:hypothetical protein
MIEPAEEPCPSASGNDWTTSGRKAATIEPNHRPTASTSRADESATLRRKPARVRSSSSFSSNLAPAAVGVHARAITTADYVQGIDQPLAYDFFNPAMDLQPSSRTLGTALGSEKFPPATQPLRRSDSLFRRGNPLSLPTFNSLPSSPLPPTHFSAMNIGGPSPFSEYARPAGAHTEMDVLILH